MRTPSTTFAFVDAARRAMADIFPRYGNNVRVVSTVEYYLSD